MDSLLQLLASLVITFIERTGYLGITVLMALESANIPIPSEIIMPFSGYLVFQEKLSFFWVVFWGAGGNLIGSLFSYFIGFYGGRTFLEKYGKFFFLTHHDVDLAEKWFKNYGTITIFVSRLLPVVRTFISFPAGIGRMNIWKFSFYTFLGSFLWSALLTYVGVIGGENWDILSPYFRKFDWLFVILLSLGGAWWIKRHLLQKPTS